MRLSDLQTGDKAVITKILGHGAFRKRVMEMGFVRGREVKVLLHAPLRDPIKYEIMGYEVSLRRSEAYLIEVRPDSDRQESIPMGSGHGTVEESAEGNTVHPDTRNLINIALIGNPNCGKTSLFNHLTGSSKHVGNYSGVTVDAESGKFRYRDYTFNVVDLPGTYSLASYSPEELYVRKYLREEVPDVIVNVVDASNLERNLYLTTELIDIDRSMVIALNMYDELRRDGTTFDYELMGSMIGVPIVPTVSKTGEGIQRLLETVIDVFEGRSKVVRHIHVHLGPDMEHAVSVLKDAIKKYGETGHHISPRFIAIKLLERDAETESLIATVEHGEELLKQRDKLADELNDRIGSDIGDTIVGEKYGFIAGALKETMVRSDVRRRDATGVIDHYVTNKYIGIPLFFAIMLTTFWLTFALGQYPMDWLENGVSWLSSFVSRTLPDGPIKDMLADGVIGGVGGVIVFLPNILILYFCISFMEDTGYMARAAFIMDKVMHKIGLHGKSFIPLVMGFGCNVPAIMASRTIESRSSRLITILINPFISCSARIPIYVLLVGTFFPEHATLVFAGIYATGILAGVITARLLRRFWFKKDETPFVMELPPYRVPTFKTSLRHMWDKGEQYLRKMAGLILVASIIVWALNYFPIRNGIPASSPQMKEHYSGETVIDTKHDSYLEMAGKSIQPVMEPVGFHWRSSVAALAGVPAKEIVVSTLGVLYTGDEAVTDNSLGARLRTPDPETGKPDFTPASALSFMIFILLYCPCTATLVAIVRETGNWRWGIFSAVYNTLLAWCAAWIVYHVALLV